MKVNSIMPRAEAPAGFSPGPSAIKALGLRVREAVTRVVGAFNPDGETVSFTDVVVDALLAQATGAVYAGTPAATELAGRLIGRAMMDAEVKGAPWLTPEVMQVIGRSMVMRGESLHAVYDEGGSPQLIPVAHWDVEGGPVPSTWRYRCEMFGPSGEISTVLHRDGVLHVILDPSPSQPWKGTTAAGSVAARIAMTAAAALQSEFQVPVTRIIPMPEGTTKPTLNALKADLKASAGKIALPPTMKAGLGDGPSSAPAHDWSPRRTGPDPPAGHVQAHADAEARLIASLGIHPVAMAPQATAGAMREARRQLQVDVLDPFARLIEHSARRISRGVSISFPIRSDVALLQAKVAQTYAAMGYDKETAVKMAGRG